MTHVPRLHPLERPVLTGFVARTCLIMLLIIGVILSASWPSALAQATTDPSPAPESSESGNITDPEDTSTESATLVITPELPVLQATASEYVFFATVVNNSAEKMSESLLALSVNTDQVASVSAAPTEPNPDTTQLLTETQIGSLEPGERKEVTVTVTPEQFPFNADTSPGVYTLIGALYPPERESVDLHITEIATAQPTYFTWQGFEGDRATAVTFVVPLLLPNDISVMPSRTQLSDEMPRLQALLDAARSANATLAIDPRIIAGIRAYGTAAPASAISFLDKIETSELPIFALQFNDADPSAQAALGATELLAPLGFEFVTRNGTFTSATERIDEEPVTEFPDAAAADDDGASDLTNPVPTDSELDALPQAYAGAWPAAGQVDQQTLTLLRNSGLTSIVLDSTNVALSATPKVELPGVNALVADAGLGSLSTEWLNARTAADRARAASQLLAHIAAPENGAQANMVLAVERASAASSSEIPELLALLLAQPGISARSERDIPSSQGSLKSAAPLESRVESLRALNADSDQVSTLSPLLETPTYLLEYERIRLMGAYATRHAAPSADFETVAEKFTERTNELLQGVTPVSTTTTQLIGVSSQVPVTLHNNLPFDARVTVRVAPGSAAIQLENEESSVISVPARGNALYLVAVNSRVSSGVSQLFVDVQDQDRLVTYSQLEMQLTLRSAYETVLLATLAISAITLLAAGIWRSVRQRKASAAGEPAETSELPE